MIVRTSALALPALALVVVLGVARPAAAQIDLVSLPTGSEGDTRFTDTTPLGIDSSGDAFTDQLFNPTFQDFDVTGSVATSAAFNTAFDFTIRGMSNVDPVTGSKLADGGIDRAGNGDLGIRGGGSNGVDQNEGYLLGIDASNLDPSLAFQLTGVGVAFLGGAETGQVVNRSNIGQRLSFGAVGSGSDLEPAGGSGMLDVSGLGLTVNGGDNNNSIASIFADAFGTGGFRFTGFQIDVVSAVPTSEIVFSSLASGSEGSSRFLDRSRFNIDSFGTAFTIEASPQISQFQDFDVTGSVLQTAAFDTEGKLVLQGVASADQTTGEKLLDGGIDRDSQGRLGIRQGANNGIESGEGYLLGIDATNLDPSLAYQITDIEVAFLAADENGKVVNRNDPTKSITFGASGTGSDVTLGSGFVDVTDLDLIVPGGLRDDELGSVIGGVFAAEEAFRITGFKMTVIDNVELQSDFDGSGSVTAADLDSWELGFGDLTGASRSDGDADGDGDVDGLDVLTWQRQLGAGGGASQALAVPEPGSALLIGMLGLAACQTTHRRRAC